MFNFRVAFIDTKSELILLDGAVFGYTTNEQTKSISD